MTDSDCTIMHVCSSGVCEHKPVFPGVPLEIAGIIVLSLLVMLSNVGGIGGGGIVVPLVMAFFNFNTKHSIAISGLSIFLSSLTRYVYNFKQMHPQKETVVIDYGLAIVMLPTVLMGSFLGVLINVTFPPIILQIVLTLLLAMIAIQSGRKGVEIFKKENVALK